MVGGRLHVVGDGGTGFSNRTFCLTPHAPIYIVHVFGSMGCECNDSIIFDLFINRLLMVNASWLMAGGPAKRGWSWLARPPCAFIFEVATSLNTSREIGHVFLIESALGLPLSTSPNTSKA